MRHGGDGVYFRPLMSTRQPHRGYFNLVSGHRADIGASLMRGLLWLLSLLYRAVVALRNVYYNWAAQRVVLPVVSIGNLTVGGTGKTPLVALVVRRLVAMGHRPLVVSRGYKRTGSGPGDEAADLARVLPPAAAHVENSDRIAAIGAAVGEAVRNVVVLDDGFQHRRLRRNLDIVTVDATQPFGYGHCLPRGLLREPVSGLRRAHAVVIMRSDQVTADQLTAIERRVRRHLPGDAPILHAAHQPTELLAADGTRQATDALDGTRVLAFSGLGNPDAFIQTLGSLGARVVARCDFEDHHSYTEADVRDIIQAARQAGAQRIVTTTKDFVKAAAVDLADAWPEDLQPVALEIEIELREDVALLDDLLRPIVGLTA
jgi:tetraacyldisaccharide 4'-kinase